MTARGSHAVHARSLRIPPFRTNNFQSFKRILVSRCAQFCAQSPFLGRLGSGFRAAQREESSLNRISLWVNVTLRNRDRAMPCDPRQRERIATGLGKASESRVPEDVGLKALYN